MNRKRKNRLDFNQDEWPAFIFMHVIFFLVQLIFFWIYFSPPSFLESNIPVIYYRIQQIGYPTVLICSLLWLNNHFFPQRAKHLVISIAVFIVEWFGIDRIFFIGH